MEQEFLDYYCDKEYKEDFDPRYLPDGEHISVEKRFLWLAEYIDRLDSRNYHGLIWQIYKDIKFIVKVLKKLDDKYFIATDRFEIPVVEMEQKKHKVKIDDMFECMEQYIPDDAGIFITELLPYEFTHLSTGEYQYAKVLGTITDCLKLGSSGNDGKKVYRDKIILLDEPEAYMHPELTRTFLSRVFKRTSTFLDKADIQIIIGTHSPLMMSDVFSDEVTRLDIDRMSGEAIVRNGSEKECFGANIYTILADSFFLSYTIGEHSRNELQKIVNRLKKIQNIKGQEQEKNAKFINDVLLIMPLIGDEFIKRSFDGYLKRLLNMIDARGKYD